MNLNIYLKTTIIFSPLKPTKLKRNKGKQNEIKTAILILIFLNKIFTKIKIKAYQITFAIAVE